MTGDGLVAMGCKLSWAQFNAVFNEEFVASRAARALGVRN